MENTQQISHHALDHTWLPSDDSIRHKSLHVTKQIWCPNNNQIQGNLESEAFYNTGYILSCVSD
jgi:hypothetical protein